MEINTGTKYAGVYNYTKDGLPITKMIEINDSLDVVIAAVLSHQSTEGHRVEAYHISEWEGNWESERTDMLPQKVKETPLTTYVVTK